MRIQQGMHKARPKSTRSASADALFSLAYEALVAAIILYGLTASFSTNIVPEDRHRTHVQVSRFHLRLYEYVSNSDNLYC
jgi:hypothetical protein